MPVIHGKVCTVFIVVSNGQINNIRLEYDENNFTNTNNLNYLAIEKNLAGIGKEEIKKCKQKRQKKVNG